MIPEDCPACGKPLYRHAIHRPAPALSWSAWGLVALGCASTVPVYWGGILFVRSMVRLPMWLLALVWFPVAVLPALGFGLLASRLPRVVKLHCHRCGWRQRLVWARTRSAEDKSAS